jgi:diadenosine tetraphosphatase ApaH/serine/threonine PP2A family protein phosphatase
MRYAIFSDVHANREAFDAVLEFLRRSHIDRFIFVGDIVGYGADPAACITLLKELYAVSVAGNHDWAVAGKVELNYFNEEARLAVAWTQGRLEPADMFFLAELNLVEEDGGCCLVHGTLERPEAFDYMKDTLRASTTFRAQSQQICLVGHSHWPGVFVSQGDRIVFQKDTDLIIEEGMRVIVNAGSVGQPRDGDPRACCCIYDTDGQRISFHRIAYDVQTAARKIKEAGLPCFLAERLAQGH